MLWHIPAPLLLPESLKSAVPKASVFFDDIPVRLIAVPLERAHLSERLLGHRGVFAYTPGRYYIAQVSRPRLCFAVLG